MFNAATFLDTTHMGSARAKRLEQMDDIDHQPRVAASTLRPAVDLNALVHGHMVRTWIWQLELAGARFALRRDQFAQGKDATCMDIAAKLQRFGSFASDKQAEFAYKLVGWSAGYGKPHPMEMAQEGAQEAPGAPIAPVVAPTPVQAPVVRLPRLFDLMQRLSKLTIGDLTVARKNQSDLLWVKVKGFDSVVAKIEGAVLTTFHARLGQAGTSAAAVTAALLRIEADPEAAAALHGKLSGRCSICSRDLTDPSSIERGIGPICLNKAGW